MAAELGQREVADCARVELAPGLPWCVSDYNIRPDPCARAWLLSGLLAGFAICIERATNLVSRMAGTAVFRMGILRLWSWIGKAIRKFE